MPPMSRADGETEVQLPLRRTEIARLPGLATEAVSRCLNRTCCDGIIRRRAVIKNPPRLQESAEN